MMTWRPSTLAFESLNPLGPKKLAQHWGISLKMYDYKRRHPAAYFDTAFAGCITPLILAPWKHRWIWASHKFSSPSRCSWALLSRRSTHLFLLSLKNSIRSSVCCFKILTTSTDRAFKGGSHPFRNNSKLFPMGFAAVKQIFPRSPARGTNYCTPRHKVTESPGLFSNPLATNIMGLLSPLHSKRPEKTGWVGMLSRCILYPSWSASGNYFNGSYVATGMENIFMAGPRPTILSRAGKKNIW